MNGQLVVVKDFSGKALVRVVSEIHNNGVYIHSKEEWDKKVRGESALDPVGFPIGDVFLYDNAAKAELEKHPNNPQWENMTPIVRH